MCMEIYGGLDEEADQHLAKQFEVENNEMVLEKDITFYSMCEHHLMPFYGKAHIAYISRRQSYRTQQTCPYRRCLCKKASDSGTSDCTDCRCTGACVESPEGVMVMLEAEHTCMTMRGIKKPGSKTITTSNTRGVQGQTVNFRSSSSPW